MIRYRELAPWTLLGLRAVVAAIFLWHGVPKAVDWAGAATKFVGMGFPGFLGPIIGLTEVIAATLLLLGWRTRLASATLLGIIAVAIVGVQLPGAIEAGTVTAGLERDLMILAGAFVLWGYAGPVAPWRRRASAGA